LKKTVTPEKYIALLNHELKMHPGYRPGMEFVPSPAGASGPAITGFSMMNLDEDVFSAVSREIFSRYRTGA